MVERLVASALTSVPALSSPSATTSSRCLPYRSPRRPKTGVRTEALSRNAVSTQVASVEEACRSAASVGRAGATIDCSTE
jgi:hypothetical protein